jgi:hypothetical protein
VLIYSVYIAVGTIVMKLVSAVQSSLAIFASATLVFGCLMGITGAHFPTTSIGWFSIAGIVWLATVIPVVTALGGALILVAVVILPRNGARQ